MARTRDAAAMIPAQFTPEKFAVFAGKAAAERFCAPLCKAMEAAEINTGARLCAFLAQVSHESGGFAITRELWGPTPDQIRYERDFNAPWPPEAGGANRKAWGLGNSERGDGKRFRGRGLIQVTGRGNTLACSIWWYGDDRLLTNPELLEEPEAAALSAAWFWHAHGCNAFADRFDFIGLTKRINGGTNGLDKRQALWTRAKNIFSVGLES